MNKLESEIENPFADWVNNHLPYWIALKLNIEGRKGYPDRLLLGPLNDHFFIEFKRPGEDLEPLQKHIINELRKLGHTVYVCESTEDAKSKVRARF